MNFTEEAEELSRKYNLQYAKTYDLMTYISLKIILDKPVNLLFNQSKIHEETYSITDRYLRRKKYGEESGMIPSKIYATNTNDYKLK